MRFPAAWELEERLQNSSAKDFISNCKPIEYQEDFYDAFMSAFVHAFEPNAQRAVQLLQS